MRLRPLKLMPRLPYLGQADEVVSRRRQRRGRIDPDASSELDLDRPPDLLIQLNTSLVPLRAGLRRDVTALSKDGVTFTAAIAGASARLSDQAVVLSQPICRSLRMLFSPISGEARSH
jgi:hypothetical protein